MKFKRNKEEVKPMEEVVIKKLGEYRFELKGTSSISVYKRQEDVEKQHFYLLADIFIPMPTNYELRSSYTNYRIFDILKAAIFPEVK